jgi:hypothetical protein
LENGVFAVSKDSPIRSAAVQEQLQRSAVYMLGTLIDATANDIESKRKRGQKRFLVPQPDWFVDLVKEELKERNMTDAEVVSAVPIMPV